MEERDDPNNHHHDHHDNHVHFNNHHHYDNDHGVNNAENDTMNMQLVVPSMSNRHLETYIIQVPKDQIYRVPPPEHAEIVERYRNPINNNNNNKRKRCGFWCLSIILAIACIISMVVCVRRYTLSPKPPTFSIRGLNLVQINKKKGFQVSVQTANPNSVNDLEFKEGKAWLYYKEKEIGKGIFRPPSGDKEERGQSDVVDVVINDVSKSDVLPSDLQPEDNKGKKSGKNNRRQNKPVKFDMDMDVPVKMKTWLWTKSADVKVKCEVEVDSLGDNSSILSQNCDVHL